MKKSSLLLFVLLISQGCSLFGFGKPKLTEYTSIDVSLSRASLVDIDFENYKVMPDKVFYECGKVKRGKYSPADQKLLRFNPARSLPVRESLTDLVKFLKRSDLTWEEAGKNKSPADPGELKMTINTGSNKYSVVTSLDSISDPRTQAARELQEVVRKVRAMAGKAPCGNDRFYGLSALQN